MDLNSTLCCKETKKYSEEYDCYYCESCNRWSEDKCGDPTCEFCNSRPESPNDVNEIAS